MSASKKLVYSLPNGRSKNGQKNPAPCTSPYHPIVMPKEKRMSSAVAQTPQDRRFDALPLDEDGFLVDQRIWNRQIAEQLAIHLEVGSLNATHWLIVDFMRDRYYRLGALPPMRNLCRKVGVDRAAVKQAFGSCRNAWTIAGLPNPGSEALSYMS
jgi:TusE/DsrC/DsvC family sulfur relay protein